MKVWPLLGAVLLSTTPIWAHDVVISLQAPWTGSSILSETSEFFRQRGSEDFWRFVDNIAAKSPLSYETDEKEYEISLAEAADSIGEGAIDLLKISLAVRAHAPQVVAFHQMGIEHKLNCEAFFDVHSRTGCTKEELVSALESADEKKLPELTSSDVKYSPVNSTKLVLVYGKIGSTEWKLLHDAAVELVKAGKCNYVFRHYNKHGQKSISLSGYGVELSIKNTEYKAQDDSNTVKEPITDSENLHGVNIKLLKTLYPDHIESLQQFQEHLREIDELAPLKQWQVQDLGFQAAQKVVSAEAENAIDALVDLSQNFPTHARLLARETVDDELRKEIELNQGEAFSQHDLSPGDSALYINGIKLDVDDLDIFQMLETLKQEEKLGEGFFNMGFRREYLSILVSLDMSSERSNYGVDYRDAVPFYVNNLDTDKKYKQWGNSVKLMLQPYYPGMIRPIARNLFNLIFVVDPKDKESRNLMKIAQSFYQHEIPLRIGLVFSVSPDKEVTGMTDAGVAILNLFNFVLVDTSVEQALKMVNKLYDGLATRDTISVEEVHTFFKRNFKDSDINDVFGASSDYDKGRAQGAAFLKKSAIGKAPKVLLNGYALEDEGISGDKIEETIMMEIMKITPKLQKAVMDGTLKDKSNVQNWLLEQPDIMPRLNKRILSPPTQADYLDLTNVLGCKAKNVKEFEALDNAQKGTCMIDKLKYMNKGDEESTKAATLWVVTDLETEEGRDLAYSHIKHLKHSSTSRIAFIPNPSSLEAACKPESTTSRILAALRLLPSNQAKLMVTKFVKEENQGSSIADLAVGGMNVEAFEKDRSLLPLCEHIKMHSVFAKEVIGVAPGKSAIVANGMRIGPLDDGEKIEEEDVVLLEKLLHARGAKAVATHIDKWEVEKKDGKSSNVVLRTFSLIGRSSATQKRSWVALHDDKKSVVTLNADDPTRATLDVFAVVDPLSREAQKLAPILHLLRKTVNCDIKIVMNPKAKLSELPLKRFYRYVAAAELQFDSAGQIAVRQARFSALPTKQLLALSVHPPEAWMIEAVSALYDLDNIQLDQVSQDVEAVFELQNILLEGHCFDEITGGPPRGLQFDLGNVNDPTIYDTIVMANLGYFQLKANPGAWLLQLREGKSKEIYKIQSHLNTDGDVDDRVRIIINSFNGKVIRVRVAKNEGKEDEKLLDSGEEGGGIWSSLGTLVGEKHETINVFSLASGHLYERFMRIMILSVMKTTKSNVKFWLLKNYLSPQFKEDLPLLAQEYGFEYQLVEYKWPRWLHQQKEKHRIMWGYKILFLDVLFPLDVQKIIFVDADQVVRSDLIELMNYGLDGNPYGYVPFCDSRQSMEGFRFWKQGYWKNHLAGRRYHISALYVVDLHKFRQIAAGDRLRGQYQGLSADPNSLSNLDQDLPNNMIHQVRIKSLPQEWLWCETWCDDESKGSAKTIDLCNNPHTKEPKLESAQRIIPEWRDYDREIKEVVSRRSEGLQAKSAKVDDHTEL
ncbi:unnamed protein product, partial [Mesorhabditis belari]|uniref:UDP-glucose:glycoprotein glucosyltransferase n=1 Tax=Mesorhabditis belari TaxID=2138241 RepID=A0AAF3FKD1_9BILA